RSPEAPTPSADAPHPTPDAPAPGEHHRHSRQATREHQRRRHPHGTSRTGSACAAPQSSTASPSFLRDAPRRDRSLVPTPRTPSPLGGESSSQSERCLRVALVKDGGAQNGAPPA